MAVAQIRLCGFAVMWFFRSLNRVFEIRNFENHFFVLKFGILDNELLEIENLKIVFLESDILIKNVRS